MSNVQPATADALPHAYPLRLLDRIVQRQRGDWVVAIHSVGFGDENLNAGGTVPPVMLLECMEQAAGLAAVGPGERAALVAAVDRFRARPAQAGDRLVVFARVVRRFGQSAKMRATVRKEERWIAAADLVLRFL